MISAEGGIVLASASTLDKQLNGKVKIIRNVEAASLVGKLVAQRALDAGIKQLNLIDLVINTMVA